MTMSYLSMMEARLPPGFRFHPRDDELVCDYLMKKVTREIGSESFHGYPMIIDVDLNKCEPWDLPELACVGGKDWYFFSLRDRKYATGQRTNRATQTGYWKATGKDRPVTRNNVLVGMRKTLVFYGGRAPHGSKTDWVMHEFRMEPAPDPSKFSFKEDWVLCKVTLKSKGEISKPENRKCQDDTSCSYIPPHKDTYLTFDQAPLSLEGYEQVPCFSILSSHGVAAPPMSLPDHSSYDKKYNKILLNHFSKLDDYSKMEHPPNGMQGNMSDFLSENGASHMWSAS